MEDVLTYEFFHCHFSSHQVPKDSLQVTDEPPDFLTLCKTLQDVSRGDDTQLLIFPFLWLRPRSVHLAQSHARCRPSAVPVTAGHNNSRSVTLPLPAGRSGTDPSLRRHRLSSHTARPAAIRPTAPLPGRRRGAEARPSPAQPYPASPAAPHSECLSEVADDSSGDAEGGPHRAGSCRAQRPGNRCRALHSRPARAAGRSLPPTGRRAGRKAEETAALPRAAPPLCRGAGGWGEGWGEGWGGGHCVTQLSGTFSISYPAHAKTLNYMVNCQLRNDIKLWKQSLNAESYDCRKKKGKGSKWADSNKWLPPHSSSHLLSR